MNQTTLGSKESKKGLTEQDLLVGFVKQYEDAKNKAIEAKLMSMKEDMTLAAKDPDKDIDTTLEERGSRYGTFTNHARITQNIKEAMRDSPNWSHLDKDMKESLEMVAHKVGRILNGDPNYHDSWHDIVGYTKLVADRLLGIIK